MRYGHVNLVVTDITLAADFYARYFDFSVVGEHGSFVVMQDESGFDLVLEKGQPQSDGFHFGFRVEHVYELLRVRKLLRAGGLELFDLMQDQTMTSIKVHDPDGHTVEIYCD